jgi:hypothetical protein
MTIKRAGHRKYFSIEDANATLPLVGAIVTDLAELSRELNDRQRRLSFLLAGRNPDDHDLYHEELVQVQKELEKDTRRLLGYREELRALGAEPENGPEGFVHFPALLDARKVFLCWKLGESEVLYWHEPEANCTERLLLTADSVLGGMNGANLEGQ